MKRIFVRMITLASLTGLVLMGGCGKQEQVEVQVFAAASLEASMNEIIPMYEKDHPNTKIVLNADSSGTLLTQVQEGYHCDLFFSAAKKQVKVLEEEGYAVDGSKVDLLKNQVVLITPKGSNTAVTGFDNLQLASSFALADGSVPVGKYTRNILVNMGILSGDKDSEEYQTAEVSEALGGIEINECGNVSKVKEAVKEGNNEIGTVYYSDAYSIKDDIEIIATAEEALSGEIVYPAVLVKSEEQTTAQLEAARDFLEYLQTDSSLEVFKNHMFVIPE